MTFKYDNICMRKQAVQKHIWTPCGEQMPPWCFWWRCEGLTSHEHFELFVVELHLPVGHLAALGTLPHRVHETHAGQRHLLTAALITETPATPPAVVLRGQTGTERETERETGRECEKLSSLAELHLTETSKRPNFPQTESWGEAVSSPGRRNHRNSHICPCLPHTAGSSSTGLY